MILVDGRKASVLQLIDTENNNEKALVKDMIHYDNKNLMIKGINILGPRIPRQPFDCSVDKVRS